MTDTQPVTPKKPSLAKTFGVVAVLTVLSKFAGLARDIFVARAYGTGLVSDAYNYAYLFTGNILILFGGLGGPFHASTVAVVGHKKDDEDAGALVGQVMAITVLLLSVATLVIYLLAHLVIVPMMAAQYKNKDGLSPPGFQEAFASSMLQQLDIMLPLIVIAGIIGVMYGVLNIFNKVAWPSISPAIASIAIIVAVVAFNDPHTGLPLALGTLAGAIGQLLVQLPAFLKSGFSYSLPFKPHPELKKYLLMLWPALISTQIGTLTTYVDMAFANSTGSGSWTAIVNANRLIQLPLGVLLTAMVVPILPRFTEQVKEQRIDDLKDDLRRALRVLWFLGLPISAILLALPYEIIHVLFQRGQWTDYSTYITTAALVLLVPSIFFYLARDLITRVFYAYHDSQTPFRIGVMAIFVKAFLDYLLVMVLAPIAAPHVFNLLGSQLPFEANASLSVQQAQQVTALSVSGIAGLSLATSIMTVFNLGLLTFYMRKKVGKLGFTKLISPVTIMLVASSVCAGVSYGAFKLCEPLIPHTQVGMLISVGAASLAGMVAYMVVCLVAKLEEPHTVARRIPVLKRFV